LYLPKYDVFWAEISVVPVDCLYVCAYLISIFSGVVEIQKKIAVVSGINLSFFWNKL
jgi:hypothetical protein